MPKTQRDVSEKLRVPLLTSGHMAPEKQGYTARTKYAVREGLTSLEQ